MDKVTKSVRVEFIRLAFEPVGKVAEFMLDPIADLAKFNRAEAIKESLDIAWGRFNRGSGVEIEFLGPSASVGDIFRVTVDDDSRFAECWQVGRFGFNQLVTL